jgi:hypothetical protein
MSDLSMIDGGQGATDEERADQAGRVAGTIIRVCLATMSDQTEEERTAVARQLIAVARGHGDLVGHFTAGVGGVIGREGTAWFAGVCLECAWVGDIGVDELGEHRAHRDARAHVCPGPVDPHQV